jgi:hypothetical protein
MSEKDLKELMNLVKQELKNGVTKEEALRSFVSAGILDNEGHYTKTYKELDTVN